MRIKAVLILLVMVFTTSCSTSKYSHTALPYSQSLNGDWQFQTIPSVDINSPVTTHNQQHDLIPAMTIAVPNNWVNEGVEHAGDAIYSRHFDLPTKATIDKRYWLDFTAVDYSAKVKVNSVAVGSHQGYFAPFSFDISAVVEEGENQLEVLVSSPNETLNQDWSLNKTLIKGVLNHHDTRPGGAWSDRGQDRNSGGIWGGVALRTTGLVAIEQMNVTAQVLDVDLQQTAGSVAIEIDSLYQGEVTFEFALEHLTAEANSTNPSTTNQNIDAQARAIPMIENYQFSAQLTGGKQTVNWSFPQAERALWWPWDWGTPHLYQLSVKVHVNGVVSDLSKQNIGFRKFAFAEDKGIFYVNERDYFIRGTNYIASQWLGGVSKQNYSDDINLMRGANINSIRVHAHVAGKPFYQQADKLGMVVWQDFPLQWGYSDSKVFRDEAVSQAKSMTDMLYNHASIAFWCGQNEPPWDATWMQYKYPSYDPKQNSQLTEAVYQQLLSASDDRIVRKASYTAEHPWLGWYSGHYSDYANKPKTAIISEFGAQSMPNYPDVVKMLGEEPEWPLTQDVIAQLSYHNYQPRETLLIAKVHEGESLSQFVTNSQEYQRLVTKSAIEKLRLNKGQGLAAIYQFMFNDSWNAITWSVLDVSRNEKPGFRAMQQSYQALLPVLQRDSENLEGPLSITIINDGLSHYRNIKMMIIDNEDGDTWLMDNINIDANAANKILKQQALKGLSGSVSIVLYDQQDNEMSKNDYLPQDY